MIQSAILYVQSAPVRHYTQDWGIEDEEVMIPNIVVQDRQSLHDMRLERHLQILQDTGCLWCCRKPAQIMLLVYSMGQNSFTFGVPDSWSFIMYPQWVKNIFTEGPCCMTRGTIF